MMRIRRRKNPHRGKRKESHRPAHTKKINSREIATERKAQEHQREERKERERA